MNHSFNLWYGLATSTTVSQRVVLCTHACTHTHNTSGSVYIAETHTTHIYKRTQQACRDCHPYTKTDDSYRYSTAKKLFTRVSSGRSTFEDDFKGKLCTLSFSTLHTLAKP